MLRTRDGYRVVLPRFRVRRLHRRLGTRARSELRGRAAARLVGVLVGRAMRIGPPEARFPVFTTSLGLRSLLVVTRALSPRRVELLYIRRSIPRGRTPAPPAEPLGSPPPAIPRGRTPAPPAEPLGSPPPAIRLRRS